MREKLKVKIFWFPATREVFFEGDAVSVSSQNRLGNFDVLPRHANFITLIFNKLTVTLPDGKILNYEFKRGVLEVRKNEVKIFLGF
ncbi:hypothetical protein H5T58_02400 [Candidatus Parcubacteria bacterium]|nr:hypothetical protein [Candidatus Parcubacteria bacterium]